MKHKKVYISYQATVEVELMVPTSFNWENDRRELAKSIKLTATQDERIVSFNSCVEEDDCINYCGQYDERGELDGG